MILHKRRENDAIQAVPAAVVAPAPRILCGVCRDADSVRRWVIVDPLVDRSISYACGDCEAIEEGAVALIKARSPHLLVTSGPVV